MIPAALVWQVLLISPCFHYRCFACALDWCSLQTFHRQFWHVCSDALRHWHYAVLMYHQPFWHVSPGILPYLAGSSTSNATLATTSNSMTFCQMPSWRLTIGLLQQRLAHLSCTQLPCWLIPLALVTPRWTPALKKKRKGQEAEAHEARSQKKTKLFAALTSGIGAGSWASEVRWLRTRLLLCQAADCGCWLHRRCRTAAAAWEACRYAPISGSLLTPFSPLFSFSQAVPSVTNKSVIDFWACQTALRG